MQETLKVLIAGDDDSANTLLRVILEKEATITLTGHAATGGELTALMLVVSPHVVLFDIDAPGEEMLAAVRTAKTQGCQTGFLGLVGATSIDEELFGEMDGIFYKNAPLEDLPAMLCEIGSRFKQASSPEPVQPQTETQKKEDELLYASRRLENALRALEGTSTGSGAPDLGSTPEDPASKTQRSTNAAAASVDASAVHLPAQLADHPDSDPDALISAQPARDALGTELAKEVIPHSRDFYLTLLDELPAPVWRSDADGKYCYFNKSWLAFTGRTIEQETGEGWADSIHPEDTDLRSRIYLGAFKSRQPFEMEYRLRRYDGEYRWIIEIGRPFNDSDGNFAGFVGLGYDVTERKQNEQRLVYLATHDPLTGLPNRRTLEEDLKRVLARARRGISSVLLFLDVDNFKVINDVLGHVAGDRALVTLTQLLQNQLRTEDLLARLGGDEFVALLEGTSIEQAQIVAERARRAVEEFRFALDGLTFNLSLSIGLVPIDGRQTPVVLLSQADTAMYRAKEQGRNRVMLYHPEVDTLVPIPEANRLILQLKDALKKGLFLLNYQPIVRLSDGRIDHYEALIRLRGESGQIISPSEFIPAAERFGLMPQLTRWLVQEVICTLREYSEVRLSANLSGLDLSDESLPEFIEARLRGNKVEPGRLGFETSEIAIRKNLDLADRCIRRLKALGCRFVLDDFGAGFVSFAYLRDLPVDQLKIDGSFVRNLDSDPSQRTVVQAVQTLARLQGKETVAEWVENEAVAQILKDMGVSYGQGYFLGQARSALSP